MHTKEINGYKVHYNSDFSEVRLAFDCEGFTTEDVLSGDLMSFIRDEISKQFSAKARLDALQECREIAETHRELNSEVFSGGSPAGTAQQIKDDIEKLIQAEGGDQC